MAKKDEKKSRKHSARYEERSKRFEKHMERLGEKFGGRMEKQGKEFGEEVEGLVDRFSEHVREREERRERKERRFGTLSLIWPIVWSIFTIVFLAFCVLILNFINASLKSYFIFQLSSFILENLYIFFAFSIFFSYARQFRRRSRSMYRIISPLVDALGIVFLVWILIFVIDLTNFYVGSGFLDSIGNFLRVNFAGIFILFLALGYGFEFIKIILKEHYV